jgi:glycosyltransferase involved in cell wall biosynthesis
LRSDYSNFEIVVVDGASTDGTIELLKSYGSKISQWISEPDGGEYFAVNKALRLAKGDIIKPMPDDDTIRPDALSLAAVRFVKKPSIDVLFGPAVVWQEGLHGPICIGESRPVDIGNLTVKKMLRGKARFHSPACFIHRRVFERIGDYATKYSCGDNDFWLRAIKNNVVFDALPGVIYDSYRHESGGTETKKWRLRADAVRLCGKYGSVSDSLYVLGVQFVVYPALAICRAAGLTPVLKRVLGLSTPPSSNG